MIGERALQRLGLVPAPGLPTQVHLSVTDRCFLPCLHCDIYKNKTEDLPEQAWADTIDRLARWLGPASINFVGGEPLLRKDLERLMGRATRLGFTVSFNTNGWLLTDARAAALADAGVSIAYVSMDGIHPATVDHSRGRAGSLQKAMEAADRLERHRQPRVVVACVLHGKNAAEIPELLRWCNDKGRELVVQPLYQSFGENAHQPGWWRHSPLWPTAEELPLIDRALDVLAEERASHGKVCNTVVQLQAFKKHFRLPDIYNGQVCKAGYSDIAFDPAGNIRLCYFLEPVGNIAQDEPEQLWNSLRAMRRRHEVSRCPRACNLLNCNFERGEG